jgi:Tol biopolymer transport system component
VTGFREVIPLGPHASTATPDVDWAADRVLFTSATSGESSIVSVLPGRGSPEPLLARANGPRATPDGKTLVYLSGDTSKGAGIWRFNVEDRRSTQLTTGNTFNPVLTRDGRQVLFQRIGSGGTGIGLFAVPVDGGAVRQLTKDGALVGTIDVSPDGRSMMFISADPVPRGSFVQCDLPDCTARRPLPRPANLAVPRWMPDGRGFAYIVSSSERSNLWLQPLDGSPPRQLTHFEDGLTIHDFAWSPDGKRLAVARGSQSSDVVLFTGLAATR